MATTKCGWKSDTDRSAMKFLTSDWLFNSNDAQVIDHVFYGRVPYLTSEELENYLLDAEFRIQQLFNE